LWQPWSGERSSGGGVSWRLGDRTVRQWASFTAKHGACHLRKALVFLLIGCFVRQMEIDRQLCTLSEIGFVDLHRASPVKIWDVRIIALTHSYYTPNRKTKE
jgi:hypothetical protein